MLGNRAYQKKLYRGGGTFLEPHRDHAQIDVPWPLEASGSEIVVFKRKVIVGGTFLGPHREQAQIDIPGPLEARGSEIFLFKRNFIVRGTFLGPQMDQAQIDVLSGPGARNSSFLKEPLSRWGPFWSRTGTRPK